jgi:hypothetical protein
MDLGVGSLIGPLFKYYFDKNNKKQELLFEARRVAYAQFLGLARTNRIRISHEDLNKVSSSLSEANLLSGPELCKLLVDFSYNYKDYRFLKDSNHFIQTNEARLEETKQKLRKIELLMKKELGIKQHGIYNLNDK